VVKSLNFDKAMKCYVIKICFLLVHFTYKPLTTHTSPVSSGFPWASLEAIDKDYYVLKTTVHNGYPLAVKTSL